MINEQIRDKEVRVIGEDGEQLGIMSAKEAMKLAQVEEAEAKLDVEALIEEALANTEKVTVKYYED